MGDQNDDVSTDEPPALNPFAPEFQQNPHLHYRAMQAAGPVYEVAGGFSLKLVTRHEDMVPVLRDTATFSNNFATGTPPNSDVARRIKEVQAKGWPPVSTMLTVDPPLHTRYRGTVAPYFTPRRIGELRPAIEALCTRLVDGIVDKGAIEFVTEFGVPLPIEAIAVVLNVPAERMGDFKRWSDDSIATIGAIISDDAQVAAQEGIVEFQHYFAEQLERRRANPSGDLMSELVEAKIDDGDGGKRTLEMAEMLSILQQLLVAGNETTTKALTEGIRLLAENPHEWEKLRADPAGRAVLVTEEVLRLSTPTQGMFRVVTKDAEIAGCPMHAGDRMVLVYSAANRDPSVWGDDPDRFDPDRPNLNQHLAFGKGIHFCIGAPLSRLEMQVAFETLARRFKSIRLSDGNTFEYHPSFILRGLKRLNVEFERAD
jgi:cytochrome P450